MNRDAGEIINDLIKGDFLIDCPCDECLAAGTPIKAKDASLFYLDDFSKAGKEALTAWQEELKANEKELKETRKKAAIKSETTTKAVNVGFMSERLAPVLKDFKFEHTDCRSIFDPIDYIIFEGLSKKCEVNNIIFAEIKTGGARLNEHQKQIKEAVEKKKVEFDVYKGAAK